MSHFFTHTTTAQTSAKKNVTKAKHPATVGNVDNAVIGTKA